jgi:hypothetical protein
MQVAILTAATAVGSLMASLLILASGGVHVLVKTLFLLLSMGAVVCAIAQWVIYFQEWVRFEIESHEERTKTKQ